MFYDERTLVTVVHGKDGVSGMQRNTPFPSGCHFVTVHTPANDIEEATLELGLYYYGVGASEWEDTVPLELGSSWRVFIEDIPGEIYPNAT